MFFRPLFQSTVGKKVIMAATGLILVGFVIAHVAGNLLVFVSAERMNAYAHLLKANLELLWVARLVLLGAVVLHVWSAVALTRVAQDARPVAYGRKEGQSSTFAARTIRVGGVVILLFVVFHLLHLTTGTIQPAPFSESDVYRNVIESFSVPWVAGLYLVAMVALGLHLHHGAWAAFRTLGLRQPSATPAKRSVATIVAVAVWLGFTSIPLAVLAGVVR
jgi:succinate dehydrogenase cytochrome b subunit